MPANGRYRQHKIVALSAGLFAGKPAPTFVPQEPACRRTGPFQRYTGYAVVYFICSMAKLEVMFDSPSVLVISFL